MALQLNVNNMASERNKNIKYIREAVLCITLATVIGLIVYQLFLYFKLAIFGWNIGLIFAPLVAGYVETILARRIIGEDIGAISAFLLFAYTTFYSFILKNPTLGMNFITIGSIAVILQAAFPTLVNYLIITIGLGTILYIFGVFKKLTRIIYRKIKSFVYTNFLEKTIEEEPVVDFTFDEMKSNEMINSLDFIFITSTDISNQRAINLGQHHATVIIKKAKIGSKTPEEFEQETMHNIKKGKDECIVNLVDKIKAAGGNGIIDLDIQYSLVGLGGESYQVTALGMGIYLSNKHKNMLK